ncbi:WD repeat-containing protein 81 isoform X2 [Atheta coriaria]|uniref:WD repeat-containing protein 81 isoform X2 n=1 Tax=Dalotia coriaria TaxID=877792 RepID=UPI0031F35DE9
MDNLVDELGIPNKFLKSTTREDRFTAIVPKSWLKSLLKHSRLAEFNEKLKLDSWPNQHDDIDESWQKIYVKIFKKADAKVIPLPRIPPKSVRSEAPLMFSQLMQYIAHTNYKNLWKDAYKKYNSTEGNRVTQVTLCNYNEVIRETIIRTYGCAIINTCDSDLNVNASESIDVHSNIYGALCAVETLNAIFLIHAQYVPHNLYDCLTFSPSILEQCYTKPLFLVYQLVNALRTMHERSLTVGDITLKDIYLSDDLWLHIFPQLCSNIHVQEVPRVDKTTMGYDCRKLGHRYDVGAQKCSHCGLRTYDKVRVNNGESLEKLTKLWIHGEISNYTYLMALNALAGRKFADPNCHYVFPWVTDFSERGGRSWRDMKKSKFRLNKGDRQLDLTYEHVEDAQVPHHVSDVLSSITYYVYMARRTPKSVLCKNVRPNWVPAEYPSSILRLQEWTPDECIPEFFSDPMIFKSVHDDLGDLDVPPWSTSPEDFIDKHREALESQHVSERLHHWIDLTFGYKLSGTAAIKSKNVCLHLVDGHTNLTSSGVVQLFVHPHPPRLVSMPFWGKIPPKVYPKKKNRDLSTSSTTLETSRSEEEDPSVDEESLSARPLVLSRLLSRSRSSLNEDTKRDEKNRSSSSQRSASLGPKNPTFTSHVPPQKTILPKEFNPSLALINLENVQSFLSKTFHTEDGKRIQVSADEDPPKEEKPTIIHDVPQVQNAFTNRLFQQLSTPPDQTIIHHNRATKSFTFPIDNQNILPFRQSRSRPVHRIENQIACPYSDIITKRRTEEMQTLGCLIVEIFMHKQIRVLQGSGNALRFKNRLKICLTVLNSCKHEIPNCIKHLVHILLPPDEINTCEFKYAPVSECGLPPPSAHLLLEPLLHSLIPFNEHFAKLYGIISMLKDYEVVATELHILYNFTCNGDQCAEFEMVERTKLLLTQNIAECKVKSCANQLEDLIDDLNSSKDIEIVNILVLPIRQLIDDPPTAVLSAWYLFDSVARSLGLKRSVEMLLQPILRLYEHETSDANIPYNTKIARLYHHSFLLRLMVRFGLRTFLEHFITPLVEAVGGYRDLLEEKEIILHSHADKHAKKANLKSFDSESHELSPSDDSSESETKLPGKEPEVFHFDGEEVLERLQSNLTTDQAFHNTTVEDTRETDELTHLDVEYKGLMTPTIPIPSRKELSNISCDVGSKKSEVEFPVAVDARDSSQGKSNDRPKNEAKISSMATESIIWLSHRLGPVLTARYLSRNLLKMLTLCYVGKENLIRAPKTDGGVDFISIACSRVVGDNNAAKVLECLASIAALYGHQLILYQYLPHMSELIALCKRKLTANLEGGLISCLALLKHIIPYISDATLMENLQDVILKNILYPTIRLLGSTKYTFPNGSIARNVLARKYLDTLYVLSLRMGATMTHTHLAVPALQRFFLIFDKIVEPSGASGATLDVFSTAAKTGQGDASSPGNLEELDTNFIEVRRDGTLAEWAIGGRPVQISRLRDSDSTDSLSPPQSQPATRPDETVNLAVNELKAVFTADLAHTAYVPFMKQIGLNAMESSLKNYQRIIALTQEYELEVQQTSYKHEEQQLPTESRSVSGSIGSNIALIGNRIDVQDDEERNADMLNYVSNKIENTQRHLRGNWLAYWEHEIGRSDKDTQFNFKQIKLQTFTGHTNSVKSLYILDNENSFLSASKDKTVKLWSLRSQGDGTSSSTCQSTYPAHKKGVFAITFLEGLRLVASCDGVVHLWDPFMCAGIAQLESPKYAPVHVLKSLPAPSSLLFAASAECSIKVIDARICSYVHDLKVAVNQGVWIRCVAIAPSGNWIATGLCSGHITVLDTRTGLVLSTWRAHDSEIVQLVTSDDDTLISSGMDQSLHVWNVHDGKLKFSLKGVSEPVHCLNVNNGELISGTTGNRIGVHTSIDADASFSSTKLRSDAFKGALVSMAMLPLNRLLLLGADTGVINLLC